MNIQACIQEKGACLFLFYNDERSIGYDMASVENVKKFTEGKKEWKTK